MKPNVVLFITHDTGQHISPYGVETVHTPNYERLAREGITFMNSFCTCPLCAPSRACAVTSHYPHQNGVNGLTGDPTGAFDLNADEIHAAKHFANAGYESMLLGFEHETRDCIKAGFEKTLCGTGTWFNGGGDMREYGAALDQWFAKRDTSRPFYLQIGSHETHRKFDMHDTKPDTELGLWMPDYLKDVPDLREDMAGLQGAIRRLDEGVGDILDALDKAGVTEDTIVVFTSDHGIDIPRAKGTFYDPGIEVLLLMRYPGKWQGNRKEDALISNVDLLPTLFDACGIEKPDDFEGHSFLPLLEDKPFTSNEAVFAEKTYHDTYDPTRTVRTERYKYIRYFAVNIFQDLRLATMTQRHMWRDDDSWRRRTSEELYDLKTDPLELHNLVDDPAYTDVKREMTLRLLTWMRETRDPLLDGFVPSPRYQQELEAFKALDAEHAKLEVRLDD